MSLQPRVGRLFWGRGFSEYGLWRPDVLGDIDLDSVTIGSIVPVRDDRVVVVKQVLYRHEWNSRSGLWDRVNRTDNLQRRGLELILHLHKCDAETFVALGWKVASTPAALQPKQWPSLER